MPPPGAPKDRVAQKIERDERRREATKLSVAGHTYEEIAERLGYNSRQAAFRDVKAGLAPAAKALREEADHYLAVQMARLEGMHREAWKIFEEYGAGDEYSDKADQRLAALDRVAKASAEFRKLVGLDAPAKTENKTTLDATVGYQVAVAPEELEQL
jgi:hypothetical protein